ncbi:MAG: hypothetical protein IKN55_03835 [Oscillospiraceae bacterium]|nr:hypothetical protein [Oscillospiraceae bacterium]
MKTKQVTDEQIAAALLRYGSTRQAADSLGIAQRTLQARRKRPEFQQLWGEVQTDLLKNVTASMQDACAEAVQVLRDALHDESASLQVRVNAADALLRHCLRYNEQTNIIERLDALEGDAIHERIY